MLSKNVQYCITIEQWIINEFACPLGRKPSFCDHYRFVLDRIQNEEIKNDAEAFFEAINILRNKAAHRHSNTIVSSDEFEKLKKGGFDFIKLGDNNILFLSPQMCLEIIVIAFDKIKQIRPSIA